MRINITNGDYFNQHFLKNLNNTYDGAAFPFREAMLDGDTTEHILTETFIKTRAKSLSVTADFYKEKAQELLRD